ncbi:MAG: histidine phosphatase family protein [Anaerolineales bacterium]|nr:histidine phosphatase family protein [Anaerolineales bacterium]
MKTLLILRHAKSDWDNAQLSDHDRPLNKRGLREAPLMGDLLRAQGLAPDLILSSTAVRARQTAELVSEGCGYANEIIFSRDLYLAEPEGYLEAIHLMAGDEETVMVVGHNPGMEELVSGLTKESVTMTTANLAQVALPIEHWRELHEKTKGKLIQLWRPKEI